jgi:molecular chaperone DnaK
MSQADIDKAIKDAEKFAEEDKKAKEAVETKNRADSLIFQSEKTLNELGDKVTEEEKAEVNAAIEKLKSTVAGGNTEDIKADTEALEKAFYKLSEKLYAQSNPQGGADPNMGGGYDPNMGGQGGTYYDASYEDNTNK